MIGLLAQEGTNQALNTVNVIITGAVTIIVTWLTVQRNRDKKAADKRHVQASAEREIVATKAAAAAEKTEEVLTAVKPTNGYDTLGQALAALEARVNELAERLARGDARFDNMEEAEHRIAELLAVITDRLKEGDRQFSRIEGKQSEMLAQHGATRGDIRLIAETLERLRAGFERDDPLRRRAVEEWGPDGKKRKRSGGR